MKETGTSHWTSPNTGADNSSGFDALGSGENFDGFNGLNTLGVWWSASINSGMGGTSLTRTLYNNAAVVDIFGMWEWCGLSVRCVRDN